MVVPWLESHRCLTGVLCCLGVCLDLLACGRTIPRFRIKCRCRIIDPRSGPGGGASATAIPMPFADSPTMMPFQAPPQFGLPAPDHWLQIFLTLYKVQSNIYLLDFQRIDGNPFDFMTICARIITELKALSQVGRGPRFSWCMPCWRAVFTQCLYALSHPVSLQRFRRQVGSRRNNRLSFKPRRRLRLKPSPSTTQCRGYRSPCRASR